MDNQKSKEKKFRNISFIIIGLLIVVSAIAGVTYAYFVFNMSDSTTIQGTTASADLTLTVEKIAPNINGNLVPQLEESLQLATSSKCKDNNDNVVCQVYSFTIQNNSDAIISVGGSLSFEFPSESGFINLKWKTVAGDPTSNSSVVFGTANDASAAEVANSIGTAVLGKDESETFYVVIWIEEIGKDQNTTDYGDFISTVKFVDSSGKGLTSVFSS